MIILSGICVILLVIVIRLWLSIEDYQRTIDQMDKRLSQYDMWLRSTSTWLSDEMDKRQMPKDSVNIKVGLN